MIDGAEVQQHPLPGPLARHLELAAVPDRFHEIHVADTRKVAFRSAPGRNRTYDRQDRFES
jgi:hypothetical protein